MISRRHLTDSVANGLQITGVGRVLRGCANKLHGGYVLAFHSSPQRTMVDLVESLYPDKVVSLDDIVRRLASGRSTAGMFAITVDDGYRDTVVDYCEAAHAKGWPMTFFLPTRFLDDHTLPFLVVHNLEARLPNALIDLGGGQLDLRTAELKRSYFSSLTKRMYRSREATFMPEVEAIAAYAITHGLVAKEDIEVVAPPISWEQVEKLSRQDGISFQSHGVTHQAVACLDPAELRSELQTSQAAIRAHTGQPVNHFCYPYGGDDSIGRHAPTIVAEAYDSAVTMSRGRLSGSHLYHLPRIPMYDRDRKNIARLKVMTASSRRSQWRVGSRKTAVDEPGREP